MEEIKQKIDNIEAALQKVKDQSLLIQSQIESEKGTVERQGKRLSEQIESSYQKLRDQLLLLQSRVESEKGTIKRQGERLTTAIEKIDNFYHTTIFGDGGSNIGLDKRFDRVEQLVMTVKYLWVTVIGAILSGIAIYFLTRK